MDTEIRLTAIRKEGVVRLGEKSDVIKQKNKKPHKKP